MIKVFCDKCGKEMKRRADLENPGNNTYRLDIGVRGYIAYDRIELELCYKCMLETVGEKEFAEMMRKKEEAKARAAERRKAREGKANE